MAHPNALTAGSTTGVGVVVVWLLGHFGVDISAEVGAAIAGGEAAVALFIGRKGILGVAHLIWRGSGK